MSNPYSKLTVEMLREAACDEDHEIEFKAFTPRVFTSLRDLVWRWSLPVPAVVIGDVAAQELTTSSWEKWFYRGHPTSQGRSRRIQDPDGTYVGMIADVEVYSLFNGLQPDPGEVFVLTTASLIWQDGTLNPRGVAYGRRTT